MSSGSTSHPNPARTIFLVDADAFYVSVARLLDPEGAGKEELLLVGGSSSGRGVVTSASYATRAFGVRSGMPMAQALRLCPRAVRVPVPRKACVEKSRQIRAILERFSPVVEPASIDEFYVDATGTERLHRDEDWEKLAQRVRSQVLEETGVPVSIGIGSTKLVAKMAAKWAKPRPERGGNGVYLVAAGSESSFMARHDLGDIPGVGPKLRERLGTLGLGRVSDALQCEQGQLERWLGPRTGAWLYRRIRGLDRSEVKRDPAAKSISHEETFPHDLEQDAEIERELLSLSSRLTSDLRRKNLQARTVTVKLRDDDFTTRQSSKTLPEPVESDRPVFLVARDLLRKLRRRRRRPARLVGVSLSELTSRTDLGGQLSLFPESAEEDQRDQRLSQAVDTITEKFGRGRIQRGPEIGPRWHS